MFPRVFFPARMFAPRFFPQSQGGVAPAPVLPPGRTFRGEGGRTFAGGRGRGFKGDGGKRFGGG